MRGREPQFNYKDNIAVSSRPISLFYVDLAMHGLKKGPRTQLYETDQQVLLAEASVALEFNRHSAPFFSFVPFQLCFVGERAHIGYTDEFAMTEHSILYISVYFFFKRDTCALCQGNASVLHNFIFGHFDIVNSFYRVKCLTDLCKSMFQIFQGKGAYLIIFIKHLTFLNMIFYTHFVSKNQMLMSFFV